MDDSPVVNGSAKTKFTSPLGVRFSTRKPVTSDVEVTPHVTQNKHVVNTEEIDEENNPNERVRLEPCGVVLLR